MVCCHNPFTLDRMYWEARCVVTILLLWIRCGGRHGVLSQSPYSGSGVVGGTVCCHNPITGTPDPDVVRGTVCCHNPITLDLLWWEARCVVTIPLLWICCGGRHGVLSQSQRAADWAKKRMDARRYWWWQDYPPFPSTLPPLHPVVFYLFLPQTVFFSSNLFFLCRYSLCVELTLMTLRFLYYHWINTVRLFLSQDTGILL
jgi:hypothetical protein